MTKKGSLFDNYEISITSGGNILNEKPVFFNSGKHLIVPNNEELHLYNTSTGEHVRQLLTAASKIINIQLSHNNDVWVFCECGTCYRYNVTIGQMEPMKLEVVPKLLKHFNVEIFQTKKRRIQKKDCAAEVVDWRQNLNKIKFTNVALNKRHVFASWSCPDEHYCHIVRFKKEGLTMSRRPNFYKLRLLKCPRSFAVVDNLFVALGEKTVYVINLESQVMRRHMTAKDITLTCVEIHPNETSFAVGDSLGRITLWRNIFDMHPLKEIFHWHTLPVRCFVFTHSGGHIFSGGDENVLVKWSLESQQKTFLPRLSASIIHISTSHETSFLSVSTSDSRILILNMNLNCLATVENFSRWSVLGLGLPSPILTRDPRTESVVLAGRTGHLQFCASENGRFLYTLDVTNRNFITNKRGVTVDNVEVKLAEFTRSGKWLITVQSRCSEVELKFWEFDETRQEFKLNTDYESPHDANEVLALDVCGDDIVATAGANHRFSLWGVAETQSSQMKIRWIELAARGYRDMKINAALNFSVDASLVAVGFESTLTVWDTSSVTLKASLTAPLAHKNPISHIKFGSQEVAHLVLTGTATEITCWNLVTLTVQWVVPLSLSTLINNHDSPYMAAFSTNNTMFIFHPNSPHPEFSLEKVSNSKIVAGHFYPKSNAPHLYFLNQDQQLLCFGKKSITAAEEQLPDQLLTPFASILGQKSQVDVKQGERAVDTVKMKDEHYASTIYTAAPHTLPSAHFLSKPFLESLLQIVPDTMMPPVSVKHRDDSISGAFKSTPSTVRSDDKCLHNLVDKLFI